MQYEDSATAVALTFDEAEPMEARPRDIEALDRKMRQWLENQSTTHPNPWKVYHAAARKPETKPPGVAATEAKRADTARNGLLKLGGMPTFDYHDVIRLLGHNCRGSAGCWIRRRIRDGSVVTVKQGGPQDAGTYRWVGKVKS